MNGSEKIRENRIPGKSKLNRKATATITKNNSADEEIAKMWATVSSLKTILIFMTVFALIMLFVLLSFKSG